MRLKRARKKKGKTREKILKKKRANTNRVETPGQRP